MNGINLFDFQKKAVTELADMLGNPKSKEVIKLKAPTGSGKTIILLSLIENYLSDHPNTSFIWFCPGEGDLEVQSMQKMKLYLPQFSAFTLSEALVEGFTAGSVTFINWELVTKKGNKALTNSETRNLFDAIRIAHLEGRKFIIIIDEEHSNDTKKANNIINAFSPIHIIRASATPTVDRVRNASEFYEIPESAVIAEELITRSLILNEDVDGKFADAESEYRYLLEIADDKRQELYDLYREEGLSIRPLVIIQLPDRSKEDPDERLKKEVIEFLEEMGYTVGNHMVAIWLNKEKENLDGIEIDNAEPIFLIMKQAIAIGWDCPRAKILVKLRENMGEVFTIQTVGRLRRMPLHHYHPHDELNHSYIYTFDETFKDGLLKQDDAFVLKRFFLKEQYGSSIFPSEKKMKYSDQIDDFQVLTCFYEHLISKYDLKPNEFEKNLNKMAAAGYLFLGSLKVTEFYTGEISLISDLDVDHLIKNRALQPIQTHSDGRSLMHIRNIIATKIKVPDKIVESVMRRLFVKSRKRKYRLLKLSNAEYYAFVINNEKKLTIDWYETVESYTSQPNLGLKGGTNIVEFKFPKEQMYAISEDIKHPFLLPTNVYKDYSTETFITRSTTERLFERWMDKHPDIVKWYYKNGDHGYNYLSVVYERSVGDYKEFYPDYLLETADNKKWLIEVKGGEDQFGKSRNIDKLSENKFYALKGFSEHYGFNWGFVREIDIDLYIDNTVYTDSMRTKHWIPIEEVIN